MLYSKNNTTISNSTYAFAAYRKKAEFGPATINAKSIKLNAVKNKFLIEMKSIVKLEGTEYIGSEIFDIDSMYMVFTK